jgi:hypothetical protein
MNGRIHHDPTPEGRLAAVCRSLMTQMDTRHRKTRVGPAEPDYADFREALRPYVRREILIARIDEARKSAGARLTSRVAELADELFEVDKIITDDFNAAEAKKK